MADEDWEAYCTEHGIPDADALRQIWHTAYGTGYRARGRTVSWPEMAIGLGVAAIVIVVLILR